MPDNIDVSGILRAHRFMLATLLAFRVGWQTSDEIIDEIGKELNEALLWTNIRNRLASREPPGSADSGCREIDAVMQETKALLAKARKEAAN